MMAVARPGNITFTSALATAAPEVSTTEPDKLPVTCPNPSDANNTGSIGAVSLLLESGVKASTWDGWRQRILPPPCVGTPSTQHLAPIYDEVPCCGTVTQSCSSE